MTAASARAIFDLIVEGKHVSDQQRAELARYALLGSSPVNEGALADELDVVEAVDAEREACAKLVETWEGCRYVEHAQELCECRPMAAAIRARGQS